MVDRGGRGGRFGGLWRQWREVWWIVEAGEADVKRGYAEHWGYSDKSQNLLASIILSV